MDAHILDVLTKTGLTEAEAKVYLVLLEIGSSQAVHITSKSGLHRRTVYDAIERLVEKGLVSYIKENNIKHYEAVEPTNLKKFLEEQEKNLLTVMPQLEILKKMSKESQQTNFFRGKAGLKSVFNHQLDIGEEICIMGASLKAKEILKYYFPHFDNERVERKIPVRIIFDESARNNPEIKKIPLSKIRFVSQEFGSPAATNVYGENVSIVLWTEDQPIAIQIINREIAKGYKNQFELLWSIARK